MSKKPLAEMSDDEVLEALTGRRITFVGYLSGRETTAIVSKGREFPTISGNDRGRFIHFIGPEGHRYVQVEKIVKVSRKKY